MKNIKKLIPQTIPYIKKILLITTLCWVILIVISNYYDGPKTFPATQEQLAMPFDSESSLKYCRFSYQEQETPVLGAVISLDNKEYVLPLKESYETMTGDNTALFDNTQIFIESITLAKEITRELIDYHFSDETSLNALPIEEVHTLPFIETPTKFIQGSNSAMHNRNAKRMTVKGWMPMVRTMILNPYNFITNDSFYADSNEEQPFLFFHGNPQNFYSHGDFVRLPDGVEKIDFEAELAVVIGKTGTDISPSEAMDFVAGYLIYNDLSDRVTQDEERLEFVGYQKSKYMNALSHYFVTDIDPTNFAITAYINNDEVLTCTTQEIMAFMSFEDQIAKYSQYGGLMTGEVIGLGTMAGGSLNELELPHLFPGDTVTFIGNQGLGELTLHITK